MKGSPTGGPSRRSAGDAAFEREFPGGSPSANASIVALYRTFDAVSTMNNKALTRHAVSGAARQALAVLEGAGGTLSPTVIAERLFVTTASMTSLLDTLERRGLVTRLPDPDDRRRILVSITEEGQRTVDAFLPHVIALQTAAVAKLSEAERSALISALATIRETVAEMDTEAVIEAARPRRTPKRP